MDIWNHLLVLYLIKGTETIHHLVTWSVSFRSGEGGTYGGPIIQFHYQSLYFFWQSAINFFLDLEIIILTWWWLNSFWAFDHCCVAKINTQGLLNKLFREFGFCGSWFVMIASCHGYFSLKWLRVVYIPFKFS